MSEQPEKPGSNWGNYLLAYGLMLIISGSGATMMYDAIFPSAPTESQPLGVLLLGSIFVCGGAWLFYAMALSPGAQQISWVRWMQFVLSVIPMAAFSILMLWGVFSPPENPTLFEILGHILLGFLAFGLTVFTLWVAFTRLRALVKY